MWKIECMCVVCHGPIKRRHARTALTCSDNCKRYWYDRMDGRGQRTRGLRTAKYRPPGPEYLTLRVTHEYRRDLLRFQAWIIERVDNHGLLMVGGDAN